MKKIDHPPRLPHRAVDSHKGTFGRVLVVGGSRGMIGAPALVGNAALRGGAGLATLAVPESIQLSVATLCPCATSLPLACNASGEFVPESIRQVLDVAEQCSVLAVGPGMGIGSGQKNLIRACLEQTKPVVLDADGLNNLCGMEGWAAWRRCPLVLTPHPGEFARLTGLKGADVQSDRMKHAVDAAQRWNDQFVKTTAEALPLVLVLKGAGTVVTDGQGVYVNKTGNPGMATGGAGDVLTGLLAAVLAQGMLLFGAACLAVNAHGRAGDLAAEKLGQVSLIATDLLDFLPAAMQEAVG